MKQRFDKQRSVTEFNVSGTVAFNSNETDACSKARARFIERKSAPFVVADWDHALFSHFLIAPDILRPHVPAPLELDLYEGKACVSVVAVTMQKFHSKWWPLSSGHLCRFVDRQRFLNFRTYAHLDDEPGALFLWGWMSRPLGLGFPIQRLGLPCSFADISYGCELQSGNLEGTVGDKESVFQYRASTDPKTQFEVCPKGSLAEFALERYTGFYAKGDKLRLFRVWHSVWKQKQAAITFTATSLIATRFPWFAEAEYSQSNFGSGFTDVWMGSPHAFAEASRHHPHATTSAFYEMP